MCLKLFAAQHVMVTMRAMANDQSSTRGADVAGHAQHRVLGRIQVSRQLACGLPWYQILLAHGVVTCAA